VGQPLTLSENERLRLKLLQNARQLHREARLLFKHRHYARAYALACMSYEEVAKLPILFSAGLRTAAELRVNWKRVHQRIRDHRLKLRMVESLRVPFGGDLKERWIETERNAQLLLRIKKHSLYVEKFRGLFRKPSEIVTREEASFMIRLCAANLRYIGGKERMGRGELGKIKDKAPLRDLLKRFEEEFAKVVPPAALE
jgi:AbiV family abortive infection protein